MATHKVQICCSKHCALLGKKRALGSKHSDESKQKRSELCKKLGIGDNIIHQYGKDNNKWKGDKVGYYALHDWIERQLGKPKKCEECGTTENRMYHWANKSHKYKRELTDWLRLCVPCHKIYDLNYLKL